MSHKEIILTDGETKRLQEQQLDSIVMFLDEGSKQVGVWADYFAHNLREIARAEGVPDVMDEVTRTRQVQRADLMATAAARLALKRRSEVTAEVVRDLKVRTIPPFVLWAARRAGVELFPPSPLLTAVADAAEKSSH